MKIYMLKVVNDIKKQVEEYKACLNKRKSNTHAGFNSQASCFIFVFIFVLLPQMVSFIATAIEQSSLMLLVHLGIGENFNELLEIINK